MQDSLQVFFTFCSDPHPFQHNATLLTSYTSLCPKPCFFFNWTADIFDLILHARQSKVCWCPCKGVLFVVWTVTWDMTGGKLTITVQNLHEIVRGLQLRGVQSYYRRFTEFVHSLGILRSFHLTNVNIKFFERVLAYFWKLFSEGIWCENIFGISWFNDLVVFGLNLCLGRPIVQKQFVHLSPAVTFSPGPIGGTRDLTDIAGA